MNLSEEGERKDKALWIVTAVEAVMIVAIGAYSIYETRRTRELLREKIQSVADYSARQGEKLDRMTTALEIYVGKSFSTNDVSLTNSAPPDQRIEKAIQFLEAWKAKDQRTNR